jgi:hypothetical protein
MAFLFCDSFDPYGSTNDMTTRYDVASLGFNPALSSSTPFGTGQCLALTPDISTAVLQKGWGSNEPTIYFSVRLKMNFISSGGSSSYFYLSFCDGSTAQATIRWNTDGSISLYSGGPSGTLIANLTGAFALNTWDSWQGKVVINNTTGSIELRKDGATADTYSYTSQNTRGGTSDNYANTFQYGVSGSYNDSILIDDFFLNSASGGAPNSWPGDMRAIQQVPSGQNQAQFSGSPTSFFVQASSPSFAVNYGANTARWASIVATASGTLASLTLALSASATGHAIMSLYDASGFGGGPGNLLATSSAITNPTSGTNTLPVSGGPSITKGTTYWIGVLSDVTLSIYGANTGVTIDSLAATYPTFPSTAAGFTTSTGNQGLNATGMNITPQNWFLASDAVEDGDNTYVYSSTVGQEDIYTLAAVAPSSYTVVGVEYYACWKKSDAGSRTVQLSVNANGSGDTAEISTSTLGNSYGYSTKFLATDPTGAGWTPGTANGAKIEISVTA